MGLDTGARSEALRRRDLRCAGNQPSILKGGIDSIDSNATRTTILGPYTPGMGKTSTAMAYFDWLSRHGKHVDSEGAPCHRPAMLCCPDGHVLRQWAEEINSNLPGVNLLIAKPGAKWTWNTAYSLQKFQYVERAAIRDPKKSWSSDLDYVFDTTNPKASRTIILGPYTTMRARLINIEEISRKQRKAHGKAPWPAHWCYNKKKRGFRVFNIDPFWKGKISLTMSDEGHLTRNDKTQLHWMLRRLDADPEYAAEAAEAQAYSKRACYGTSRVSRVRKII
jgi:hypothetical protein